MLSQAWTPVMVFVCAEQVETSNSIERAKAMLRRRMGRSFHAIEFVDTRGLGLVALDGELPKQNRFTT
jgi:hypothetical protein